MSVFRATLLLLLISATLLNPLSSAQRFNVLLISIDTLRADALGCYGSTEKTEAIDSFAKRSILFENTISQVPLTLPSHATIFTALFPPQHGIRNNEIFVLPQKLVTLAEVFKQNGYRTGAVVGSFALDSGFGIDQGFEMYDDQIDTGQATTNRYAERKAGTVWEHGRKWIEVQKTSWFCFLHFYDPHTAYAPPKPYPQNYAGEVSYVDTVMRQILDYAGNHDLYNTTIIVLLSDHGESLGEHGEASHGVFLYDVTLKVPLLISAPGLDSKRIKSVVRLADVAPTILELTGLPHLPSQSDAAGVSLLPLIKGETKELPAYSETYYTNLLMGWSPLRSIRSSQLKYIEAPRAELYNLSSDPDEKRNLYSSGSLPPSLRRELDRFAATPVLEQPTSPADAELKERLASLGYVTGSSTIPSGTATFDPKDGITTWTKIEAAVTSAQIGKLQEAEKGLRQALSNQPENVIAQKFLANVLASQNKDEEAIQHLKKALNSPLHQEETRLELAKLLYRQKAYAETLETLLPIVGKATQNAVALKLAGLAAVHDKQYEAANDLLERTLQFKPQDPECLSTQARILSHLNKSKEALEKFVLLETVRPLSEEEAVQAAAIHLTENDRSGAKAYFEKALQSNSESPQAWRGLALIHASHQEWNEAVNAFVKAKDCDAARSIVAKQVELSAQVKSAFQAACL